jgi:hypothetical protein
MRPLSDKLIEASEWGIHMPVELRDWLEEAAAIIKRYEDAPVATFRWDWASDTLAAGVVEEKNPSPEQLENFKAIQDRARVRILLDTEGG